MIDEYYTFLIYKYHTDDLARCSDKEVVVVCEMCGEYRSSRFRAATELCMKCGHKNKSASDETRLKMSVAHIGINNTDETCIRMSCAKQHIKRNEWTGFACNTPYCDKFDEACKERIREKYNRLCFLCGKSEKDNGKRLSVHHVDMNKDQGCNGNVWLLIPLCMHHHTPAHSKLWIARIKYLLNHVWD